MEIRELAATADIAEAVALFGTIWADDPAQSPCPLEVVTAVALAGGYVTGAYDDGRMVGASAAFLGRRDGVVHLHSHITGFLASHENRGLGRTMKLHQRSWCLARGVELVRWTFDPLVGRNAWFNLHVLGADVVAFHADFYGEGADRFVVEWHLPTATSRPAIVPSGDDVVVPVPDVRAALATHPHVVGMTADKAYALRR